jgi:serine protease AprX
LAEEVGLPTSQNSLPSFLCTVNTGGKILCPLCNDGVDKLVYKHHFDTEQYILERVRKEFPEWTVKDGMCSRCVDYFHSTILVGQQIVPTIGTYTPVKSPDDFVIIPTPLRMNADPRFTGEGVTICFIDNGFFPHQDLSELSARIRCIVDLGEETSSVQVQQAHGTMTSVVACGDGFMSKGLYKGIACAAELVLLKIMDRDGKITAANFIRALQWILLHHQEHQIRIINISLGIDDADAGQEKLIENIIEELLGHNIVVVAAVGNSRDEKISLPAKLSSVIAVGGLDNDNIYGTPVDKLYHSNFGKTTAGRFKPELIAPAMWVAAPVLPASADASLADRLFSIIEKKGELLDVEELSVLQKEHNGFYNPRECVEKAIQICRSKKFITRHYMHVDGTSFAAPIVSSIIAQLLEAEPGLQPFQVKEILFSTAKRIPEARPEPQGYGIVQPRTALYKVLRKKQAVRTVLSPHVDVANQTIDFYVQHPCATQISIAGSFNGWTTDVLFLEPSAGGDWNLRLPLQEPGKYQYKFFVDGKYWMEDFENPWREPDGFTGFNSVLTIEN